MIGVCIKYFHENYGGMLQAFATVKMLESRGIDYELIRYKKKLTITEKIRSVPRLLNGVLLNEQYYISKNNKLGRLLRLYWARRKNMIGNRIGFYIGATVFEPGITIYHHGTIIINGNAAIGQGSARWMIRII